MIKIEHVSTDFLNNEVLTPNTLYTDGVEALYKSPDDAISYQLPLNLFLHIEEMARQNVMMHTQLEGSEHNHSHDCSGALKPNDITMLNDHGFSVDEMVRMKEAGLL